MIVPRFSLPSAWSKTQTDVNAQTKAKVVLAVLIAVTIWPLVQIGLVGRFDVSPWKLAGWGMYSAPAPINVNMTVHYRERGLATERPMAMPGPEIQIAAQQFLERHRWLGTLETPRRFVDTIFEKHPEYDGVRVVIEVDKMNPDSGIIERKEREYRFEAK